MSELKCPFCNKKLEPIGTSGQFQCGTWGCDASFNFIATRDVWEYIDRTKKKLDIAVDALKSAKTRMELINNSKFANLNPVLQIQCQCEVLKINEALEQITALEQKDRQ